MTNKKLSALMTAAAALPLMAGIFAAAPEAQAACELDDLIGYHNQALCSMAEAAQKIEAKDAATHITVEHDYYDADELLWKGGQASPVGRIKEIFAVDSVTMKALKEGLKKGNILPSAKSIAHWLDDQKGARLDHPTDPAQVITLHRGSFLLIHGVESVKGNKGDVIQKWFRNGEPFRKDGGPISEKISPDGTRTSQYPSTDLSSISGVTVNPQP